MRGITREFEVCLIFSWTRQPIDIRELSNAHRCVGVTIMTLANGVAQVSSSTVFDHEVLIDACLEGSEEAWAALVERYKKLIFSVPVKIGLSRDEAGDVLQSVCAKLLKELPRLRNRRALPQWLIQVATHESFRAVNHNRRFFEQAEQKLARRITAETQREPDHIIRQTEREQLLREAISNLQPRCQRLIFMLFFEEPQRSYEQIADELGLTEGSIGFIRGRCLERLREQLQQNWNR